ncbi:flippase [Candidatus Woesearchaeota archaeon]|nr:flippase [Candidatus Woesearchaeota archaeon]
MENYTKFAIRGAAIVFVISIIAAFMGYIVRILLARNLSIEDFGLFYAVVSFLGLIGVFKSLGFDRALTKFIPEFESKGRNDLIKSSIIYVLAIQVVVNSVVIIAVYLLSNYLSSHFFHNANAGFVLKLMAIAFFIDSFTIVLKFAFQGFRKMWYFSLVDLVRMLLIIGIILIGLKTGFGLKIPVYAYILTPLILTIIFGFIFVKKVFPKFFESKFSWSRRLFRRISKYSIFVLANDVGGVILGNTDVTMLTYFTDLKNVALYSVAYPTARVLLYFPRATGQVLFPLTSELWAKKRKDLLKAGIESLYKYSIITIIPIVFVVFSFADLIISTLYGKDYLLAGNVMKILVLGIMFAVIHHVNGNFFAGIGKPQVTSRIVYAAAVFNFAANLAMIPFLGILGAAITTAAGYLIMMVMGLIEIRKFIAISYPIKPWLGTLAAGIAATAAIWLLKEAISLNVWLETGIILAISGLLYIAVLFLLRVVKVQELKDLYKRVLK